jgi:ribonuclease PH
MAYTSSTRYSLQKPVDEHAIETDVNNIQSSFNANMDTIDAALPAIATATTINTNPSIVNTRGSAIVNLYSCSAGSISTITGMATGKPFTMVNRSTGASLALLDAGVKLLSANWVGSTVGSCLTLVWDGTNYIEISRTTA